MSEQPLSSFNTGLKQSQFLETSNIQNRTETEQELVYKIYILYFSSSQPWGQEITLINLINYLLNIIKRNKNAKTLKIKL